MAGVLAVADQKGGVAKTTTAHAFGAAPDVGQGRGAGDDPFAPATAQGRRAPFSEPTPAGSGDPGRTAAGRTASARTSVGRTSAGQEPAGSGSAFTLVCRSCGARSALGLPGLATRLVPSLWLPGRQWSRYLRCPACRRPAWCRLERSA